MSGEELPEGWVWAKFNEVFDRFQYGYTASASPALPGPRFLRITDLGDNGVDWTGVPGCEVTTSDLEKYRLRNGDFVFARSGSIEKAWRVTDCPEAVFASYLIRARPKNDEMAPYLELFLKSHSYLTQIGAAAAGIGMANVNAVKLGEVELPLPPLPEQRRIVAKLDELRARSRKAREALDEVPVLLEKLKQSVLAAAFRGDLTAQWRAAHSDVEPASVLLQRIRRERKRKWEEANPRKRYVEPEPVDVEGLPELPEGWGWARVGLVAHSVKDGPHYSPEYVEDGIPFLSGRNVRPEGVNWDDAKYISKELYEEISRKCKPELGDVLYTKGGTTGIARVNTYDRPFQVWVHVAVLKIVPSILPFFLQHALNSQWCYEQSQRLTHGVGNQDLGLTRMVNITFPICSLAEQEEIVRKIDLCLAAVHGMETEAHITRTVADHLEQSLLRKAFQGSLVPQDPQDEPAEKLLARIKLLQSGKKR